MYDKVTIFKWPDLDGQTLHIKVQEPMLGDPDELFQVWGINHETGVAYILHEFVEDKPRGLVSFKLRNR